MTKHENVLGFLTGPYLLLMLALAWMPEMSYAQSANDGFDPNANNSVYALALQPDGKTIVGGAFTTIAGQARNRLARLNPDGSLDSGFAANDVDGQVEVIAAQADGRIVIRGGFTHVGGYLRNHIVRLNTDGSVDTAFDPNANYDVHALALQSDGKLVVGGFFSSLSPNSGGAITRNNIARLNADGSVDMTFDPNANAQVLALALQSDGKLVVGGNFSSLSPNGGSTITRNNIVRLNVNGSLDMTFDMKANARVYALALQRDGKLVIGGDFTALSPNGGGAITRNRLARLNADGSLDPAFDPNANSPVLALALQPDGKLLMGGEFTSLSPNGGSAILRNRIARLNTDSSVDTGFDPNADSSVVALALQSDGKLVLGGTFFSLSPHSGDSTSRNSIARLNADGSVETAFDPNANNSVYALALQPDGKLIMGGYFSSLAPNGGGTVTRNRIARLNVDGSVDTTFDPNANARVLALALQPDGKLVLGGDFTTLSPNGGGPSHVSVSRA